MTQQITDPVELSLAHTGRYKKLRKLLKRKYGYDGFRPHQYQIIREIICGRDVCAILPTGYGKSLTFQIPAIYTRQTAVVVSPLISLMTDQQQALERIGVKACTFNSEVKDKRQLLKEIRAGEYSVVYITPESLARGVVCSVLQSLREEHGLSVVAIDEAHCISSYGFDFRSDYRKLSELRSKFPGVPILAVTATATAEVADDICHVLGLEITEIVKSSFDRPNLFLNVQRKNGGERHVLDILRQHPGEPAIVYCLTRNNTEKVAETLRSHKIKAGYYHSGISDERKRQTHIGFLEGRIQVVVATIAFGMGIDKPDVRTVIHFGCPRNLEGYYQEIGRAGRDGGESRCYLLYDFGDFRTQQHFIADKTNEDYKATLTALLRVMQNYVTTDTCRRRVLLEYFDDDYDHDCGKCDNCCGGREMRLEGTTEQDVTEHVRMFVGLCQSMDQQYGKTTWIDTLRGSKAKKMTTALRSNPYYNKGSGHSVAWWKELVEIMLAKGILRDECLGGRFNANVIKPTMEGLNWYYTGENEATFALDSVSMKTTS